MSTTPAEVVTQVLRILQDPSPDDPVAPVDAIRRELNEKVSLLASKDYLGLGTAWVTPILSLVAGDDEYDLPFTAGVDYEQIQDLRYSSDHAELLRRAYDFVASLRTGSPLPTGRPQYICLRPAADGKIVALVYPVPEKAETVNGLVSLAPVPWVPDTNDPTIMFSNRTCLALAKLIAAAVGRTMGSDKVIALDLNPPSFSTWEKEAMELIRLERLVIIRLKRSHGKANYNWVRAWSG